MKRWNIVRSEFNQWNNKVSRKVVESYEDVSNAIEIADMLQADVSKYKRVTFSVESSA